MMSQQNMAGDSAFQPGGPAGGSMHAEELAHLKAQEAAAEVAVLLLAVLHCLLQ